MSKLKRLMAGVSATFLALSVGACSSERHNPSASGSEGSTSGTIGISMPTKSLERWSRWCQSRRKS